MMFPYYQIAQIVAGENCLEAKKPWFVIETNLTSDGPRTRICDGRWGTKEEAFADVQSIGRREDP